MPEIGQSGSEGGAKFLFVPTPILAQGFNSGKFCFRKGHLSGVSERRLVLRQRRVDLTDSSPAIARPFLP